MTMDWTTYNMAHEQPFNVHECLPKEDNWALYNAAHADPQAVPIHNIQASPEPGVVTASASAHIGDVGDNHEESTNANVAVSCQPSGTLDATTLAQYEAVAPGLAHALLQAEQSHAHQRRLYRLTRLAVTTIIAITAIACGQWALVNGADQQALYLSGAGLISLLTTVMQHD